MKLAVFVVASSMLASCVMHVHFHESPARASSHEESPPPAASQTAATPHHTPHAAAARSDHGTVEGVVVDVAGRPIRARIAAVGTEGGSISMSTDDQGRFAIETPSDDFVLHASTDDALIAVEHPTHSARGIELRLRPGGTLVIDLEGREKTRCAIFAQHLRAEDFTLRAGQTSRVVVPAGGVRVRLYDGDEILAEREFDITIGESRTVRFSLDS